MKNSKIAVAALMALIMFSYSKAEEIKVDFDGRNDISQNETLYTMAGIKSADDHDTDIPDIPEPTAFRIPFVKEILAKLPPEERSKFIKTLEIKDGIIFKFDKAILAKYYSGEILNGVYEVFTPLAGKPGKAMNGNAPTVKLDNVLNNIPQNAGDTFMENLQIYTGAIRGGKIENLENFIEQNDIEKILLGIGITSSRTLCTANGCLGYQCWLNANTHKFGAIRKQCG